MTPAQTMLRAAELLEDDAQVLKESHTIGDDQWGADPEDGRARDDCNERMSLAAKLRLLAAVSA